LVSGSTTPLARGDRIAFARPQISDFLSQATTTNDVSSNNTRDVALTLFAFDMRRDARARRSFFLRSFLLSRLRLFACSFALWAACAQSCSLSVCAQSFRIGGGVSTPFDQIVAVEFPLRQGGTFLYPVAAAHQTGYHLAGRALFPFERGRGATVSAGVHHFETPIFSVYDPQYPGAPTSIKVAQSLFPIGVGLEYRFVSVLIVHLYAAAEGTFNALIAQHDVLREGNLHSVQRSSQRIGANVALGAEASVFGLGVDLSARYHWINMFLREPNELSQTFVSLNLSVVFGEK
jgi:hypothetical protein